MSKVGKSHIHIPSNVKVSQNGCLLELEGPNGKAEYTIPANVSLEIKDSVMIFSLIGEKNKQTDALWGTTRANVNNIIKGLCTLYEKRIEFVGVGYRAAVVGNKIEMKLGFSHDVLIDIPEGIKVVAEKPTVLLFKSACNQKLGNFLRTLQLYRKPEPYKGKGLIIDNQYVYRKEGKKK